MSVDPLVSGPLVVGLGVLAGPRHQARVEHTFAHIIPLVVLAAGVVVCSDRELLEVLGEFVIHRGTHLLGVLSGLDAVRLVPREAIPKRLGERNAPSRIGRLPLDEDLLVAVLRIAISLDERDVIGEEPS